MIMIMNGKSDSSNNIAKWSVRAPPVVHEGQGGVRVRLRSRSSCRSGRGACRWFGGSGVGECEVGGGGGGSSIHTLDSHARIGRKGADLWHIDPAVLQHRSQLLHVYVAVAVRVNRVEDCLEPRGLEAGATAQMGGVIHTSAWRAEGSGFPEGAGSAHARGVKRS